MPVVLPPTPPAVDLSGAKVLTVDDVAATGQTLKLVRAYCTEHVTDVKIAVICEKSQSIVKPDYVWKKTDQRINFPWSTLLPVREREDGLGH